MILRSRSRSLSFFKFYLLILEWEEGREMCFSSYLLHSLHFFCLLLVCALTGDGTCNLDIWGQWSNPEFPNLLGTRGCFCGRLGQRRREGRKQEAELRWAGVGAPAPSNQATQPELHWSAPSDPLLAASSPSPNFSTLDFFHETSLYSCSLNQLSQT